MSNTTSRVKTSIGMLTSRFAPITADGSSSTHPTYGTPVDMGAAVKGSLSITSVQADIPGDDISQVDIDKFESGQIDVETTMSDLVVNSTLFGHTYDSTAQSQTVDEELSKSTDNPAYGAYCFVEPIMLKDESIVYRATFFFRVKALVASEKTEAETKKKGGLNPKMNAVYFKVYEDLTNSWRARKDFTTEAAATSWLNTKLGYSPVP